jgi:hypothetical protein
MSSTELIPPSAWPEGWSPFGGGSSDPEEQREYARLWDARNNGNPRYKRVAQKVTGESKFDSSLGIKRDESNLSNSEGSLTLPFAPLSKALANIPPEPNWVLDGYVAPRVVTLWAGRPKVGKTTLLFGLLSALPGSEEFIGRQIRQSGVLLLSEERPDSLAEKNAYWELSGDVHVLMRHQAYSLDWPTIVAEAVDYCRDQGLGVLVVDSWDKWSGLGGDAENSSGAVNDALVPLSLAAAAGLAVIVIHHQRKSVGDHGDAVRGSNAITGNVDIIVELERVKGDDLVNTRVLRATSRFRSTPETLVMSLTESGYVAKGDLESVNAEVERAKVEGTLEAAGEPMTLDALSEATDIPKGTVGKRVGELMEADRVRRTGAGVKGDPYRHFLSSQPLSLVTNRIPELEDGTA